MKWLKVAVMLVVAASTLSMVSSAQAARLFFSLTAPPVAGGAVATPSEWGTGGSAAVGTNPEVTLNVGQTVTLYAWFERFVTADGATRLTGVGHDILRSLGNVSVVSYEIYNAQNEDEEFYWAGTGTGTLNSGGTLVNEANAVNTGGSNLTFTTDENRVVTGTTPNQYIMSGFSKIVVQADSVGVSELRFAVADLKITYVGDAIKTFHFGFNDAATSSHVTPNATSTTFDAKITVVPEPGTMVLFGLGAIGLVAMARRRRSA